MNALADTRPDFVVPSVRVLGTSTEPPSLMRLMQEARLQMAGAELHTAASRFVADLRNTPMQAQMQLLAARVDALRDMVLIDTPPMRDTRPTSSLRDIVEKWISATAFSSSLDENRRDPNFTVLKRLGWAAVPELLRCIANGIARLQCAELLSEITRADPISDADLGNARRIGNAWINWGRLRGLL
jgi:hypothetical protein